MTACPAEVAAYYAGIRDVLALARATSDRLAKRVLERADPVQLRPSALDGLAEEGAALLRATPAERAGAEPVAAE